MVVLPKPLFPGYLFALFAYDDLATVLMTPGLQEKALLMTSGHPAILTEEQMCEMRGWEQNGAVPAFKIPIGQIVRFPWGSKGAYLSGVLVRVDEGGWEAIVEVSLLGKLMKMAVDLADLDAWKLAGE